MFSEERRKSIEARLQKEGRVLAKDLAEEYKVSIDSIRRDLTLMEEEGLLKRTHGGAIPVKNVRAMAQPPAKRYGEGNTYQNAIAKKAASYIKEDQTIFIGGAAIHYVLLKYLPSEFRITVVTNSIEIAYVLRSAENIKTYLIGGEVKTSGNCTDALATEFARQFTVDLCFATAGGLSVNGLSTATPEVSIFHQTIYDHSREIITLAEHVKFDVDMFSRTYPLQKLDLIITDEETDGEKIEKIRSAGGNVIIAKNNSLN